MFVFGAAALTGAALSSGWARAGDDELPALIAALDSHGIAVLQESLGKPDTLLMTSDGSANHAVWSAFAARGWMTESDAYGGGPVGVKLKTFSITPDGLAKIPAVLDAARK
jgi:hypothetical protein